MNVNKFGLLVSIGALLSADKNGAIAQSIDPDILERHALRRYEDSLTKLFRRHTVLNDYYYRRYLYTWTTQKQVADFKRDKKLLIKGRGVREVSFYEKALTSDGFKDHPLAAILREERFYNKRFSWVNSWAICNGEKNYGSQLLRITLKKEALICRINPYYPAETEVMDKFGKSIPFKDLESVKHRIAAVYYINDLYKRKRYKKVRTSWPIKMGYKRFMKENFYREYIIVNEEMIESVEHRPKLLAGKIQREIDMLESLLKIISKGSSIYDRYVNYQYTPDVWSAKELDVNSVADVYFYSLAFPNKEYQLTVKNIGNLIQVLKKKRDLFKDDR